jgi:peptidoglycan/LPS O-acetylase OafA/YrhL
MLACILAWPLISSQPFNGGMTMESGVRVLWESVLLISASFVFIHGAGSWLNRRTKLWDFLTETGYGVYVLHAIVLVFVALAFGHAGLHPIVLWLALSALCVPLTFVVAWAARLLPVLKKIL